MQDFTQTRDADTEDQLWVTEHPAVFTQGQAGKAEHVLMAGDIPVVQSDRGGQVTYHGPGQLVIYLLIDLRRSKRYVRDLVTAIEESIIERLQVHGVSAYCRADAPGVYLENDRCLPGSKIAALGLRVRRGCSYHGLSYNLQMDLEPFSRINPCGMKGLPVTQLSDLVEIVNAQEECEAVLDLLTDKLGYSQRVEQS